MKMEDAPLQVLGWFVSQPGNMDKLKRRWWALAIYGNIVTYRHKWQYSIHILFLCSLPIPIAFCNKDPIDTTSLKWNQPLIKYGQLLFMKMQ